MRKRRNVLVLAVLAAVSLTMSTFAIIPFNQEFAGILKPGLEIRTGDACWVPFELSLKCNLILKNARRSINILDFHHNILILKLPAVQFLLILTLLTQVECLNGLPF